LFIKHHISQKCFENYAGAAIGSGWQTIVAYVNVGAYYLIGLPIGCILGYKTSLGAAVSSSVTL